MKSTDDIVILAKDLCEKEIQRTITLLKDNEEKWNEYMDLKLHDCAFIDSLAIEKNGVNITVNNVYETFFDIFCEESYQQFLEDCRIERGIDFNELRDYVGRTSKFYLGNLHDNDYISILQEYSYDFNASSFEVKYDNVTGKYIIKFTDDDNIEESVVAEMLQVSKSIYNDINNALVDIIAVYQFIADFKNNQVKLYKDFIECEVANRLAE